MSVTANYWRTVDVDDGVVCLALFDNFTIAVDYTSPLVLTMVSCRGVAPYSGHLQKRRCESSSYHYLHGMKWTQIAHHEYVSSSLSHQRHRLVTYWSGVAAAPHVNKWC